MPFYSQDIHIQMVSEKNRTDMPTDSKYSKSMYIDQMHFDIFASELISCATLK